ncbi:ADP-ribosyl cyclase/cyclic ADP-ribose hydrolase 1-like isoform X1 [Candoia aspera]|uniref:ADP-ribosyl cyclase/cyclic ADP-ribose hydrolase 1-like isoform X1 n=1 Tax=Candoia aspera TaxID=51853 RepID=UPI002FD85AB7
MPLRGSPSSTRKHTLILTGVVVVLLGILAVVLAFGLLRHGRKGTRVSAEQRWKGRGTTEHLLEIVLGRCYNFISTINPELSLDCADAIPNSTLLTCEKSVAEKKLFPFTITCVTEKSCSALWLENPLQKRNKDCHKVWELFEQAFVYKDPCSVTEEDYQPLMDLARHSIPCNKSLFWSKTNDLVHRYTKTNQDFLTLEDTLLGYIADGISWCGNPSDSGRKSRILTPTVGRRDGGRLKLYSLCFLKEGLKQN